MIFDATIHLMKPPPVVEAFARLGFPISLAGPIATIELLCILIYVVPRTSVLGVVLLTGYLGGAVAAQLRIGSPPFEVTFPIIVAVFLWGGLYLRDARLRELFPIRR